MRRDSPRREHPDAEYIASRIRVCHDDIERPLGRDPSVESTTCDSSAPAGFVKHRECLAAMPQSTVPSWPRHDDSPVRADEAAAVHMPGNRPVLDGRSTLRESRRDFPSPPPSARRFLEQRMQPVPIPVHAANAPAPAARVAPDSSSRSESPRRYLSESPRGHPDVSPVSARRASEQRARSLSPRTPRSISPRTPRTPRLHSWRDEVESAGGNSPRPPADVFNIFFQNIKIAPTAPNQTQLSSKHTLPEEIYFYLHVSSYPCPYPLPSEYPEHQYLHRAAVYTGHEAAGPAIQLQFNPSTVVGLCKHHMANGRCPTQLVLRVPVTRRVNPFLAPARLTFQPSTATQLHNSPHLPRVIVPVLPLGLHARRGVSATTFVRNTKAAALKQLCNPWEGTPRRQRIIFAVNRWKRVVDSIYSDVKSSRDARGKTDADCADATVQIESDPNL